MATELDSTWLSPLHQNHELVGSIWRSSDRRFISVEELLQDLDRHRFILLGEKHDNPDHHRLQRFVLQRLQQGATLGLVSFEMLTSDQQIKIDTLTQADLGSEQRVQDHLAWDAAGWEWSFYGPMLIDAISAGVAVQAGNISRDEMMAIYQGDLDANIANALDTAQMEQLNRDIDESHCGMLPPEQFPAMVRVQQSRDARMADSLVQDSRDRDQKSLLIAGNFHVRRDLGVPNYISPSEGSIATLSFTEVSLEVTDPSDYLQGFSEQIPYDYLWFTPAVTAEDYCESMRAEAASAQ